MAVVKLSSGSQYRGGEGLLYACWPRLLRRRPHMAPVRQDPKLPELSIISTGGTIASRIDYRTGAGHEPVRCGRYPDRNPGACRDRALPHERALHLLSENMTPAIWQELARAIHDEIKHGVTGVIVTHGTDTMAYSAAAVSFMLDTRCR